MAKKQNRSSKIERQEIVLDVINQIQNHKKYSRIIEDIAKNYNKSISTAKQYHKSAMIQIKTANKEDITEVRAQILSQLKHDALVAYQEYRCAEGAVKNKWFETYLAINKDIRNFYPDLIENESDKDKKFVLKIVGTE